MAIPKTVHRERMIQNLDIFDFELAPGEFETVSAFERGGRVGNDPRTVNGP